MVAKMNDNFPPVFPGGGTVRTHDADPDKDDFDQADQSGGQGGVLDG